MLLLLYALASPKTLAIALRLNTYAQFSRLVFIYPLQEDPRFTDGMNCSRNTHSYKQSYIRSAIM